MTLLIPMDEFVKFVEEGFKSEKMKVLAQVEEGFESAKRNMITRFESFIKNENQTSARTKMKLEFRNRIAQTILTGEEIKREGGVPIEVALVNDSAGDVVDSGAESSADVEIVLLKAKSEGDEFIANIVPEVEGKKPILAGNIALQLQRGLGVVKNIKFRHHASKMKQSEFKLGARVVGDCCIKEAKSELFTLKDYRVKYIEKHDNPSLSDEVWRLDNIQRNGKIDKRLGDNKIYTVEDFLIQLLINPQGLKSIVEFQGKKWETVVNNARACKSGERVYFYMDLEQKTGIVFNILGHVLGLCSGGYYSRTSTLSEEQKEKLLASAYKNWEGVKAFNDQNSLQQCMHRNDVAEERSLLLKFLDEVSGPARTGKEFRAVKGGPLEVALFDATGNIVNSGPESSAEVEILLIDATGNGNECAMTNENFERRIIIAGNNEKPHFAQNVHVNLDKGTGSLINQKLGHNSKWTKNWTCRLGARFVKNFRGLKVQEAWTEPFKVTDYRSELWEKHEPPSPDSEVWRVKEIRRDGEPCKRLESKQIKTVLELLFWLSVNPKGLQEITGAVDSKWKTIVAHARTCKIDDKMMYYHKSSTKPHMRVIYDYVGELKGVINESHFVPIDNLSADEKVHARELLSLVLEPSAFVERYKTFFNSEASLVQQYPYKSSNVNSSTNCSIQQRSNGIGSDYINCFQTAEPRCSSKSISPNNIYDSLESRDVGEISNHALVPIPDPENIPMDLDYGTYGIQPSTPLELGDHAHKLLRSGLEPSTFVQWYNTLFDDEASLLQQFPCRSLDTNASSSQSIIASDIYDTGPSDSLASKGTGELRDHSLRVFPNPENIDGDTPTDLGTASLNNENLCFPTDKADGEELLASLNDVCYPQQQQLNGTYEMFGESSSRFSNTSFHSVNSTLGGSWCYDGVNWRDARPPSPNPMHHYADNTQMYGHRDDETRADEGVAEPQVTANPPDSWKI